jgi:hypothetical protein
MGRFLDACMAVATIHPELVDVKRVIKCGGLGGLVSHPGVFRGEVVGHARNNAHCDDGKAYENLDWQPVAETGEYVGHVGLGIKMHGGLLDCSIGENGDTLSIHQGSIRSINQTALTIRRIYIAFPLSFLAKI